MAANPDSDDHLVRRAIAGDGDAFGALYQRHMASIYRYIYYRVGDATEAEDMTETTFLRVWEGLPRFVPDRIAFRSWLYRVAHNLLIDHYRTRKPQVSLELADQVHDPAPPPETALLAQSERRWLAEAICRLNPEHQQLLALRFIAGFTHAESSRIIGRSEPATRVLQHRALKALRAKLIEMDRSHS